MADIITSRGMMDEALLSYTKGTADSETDTAHWEEWRASDGEIVKRNVHVVLKRGLGLPLEQGMIG